VEISEVKLVVKLVVSRESTCKAVDGVEIREVEMEDL
jgi:hypothetical protein